MPTQTDPAKLYPENFIAKLELTGHTPLIDFAQGLSILFGFISAGVGFVNPTVMAAAGAAGVAAAIAAWGACTAAEESFRSRKILEQILRHAAADSAHLHRTDKPTGK